MPILALDSSSSVAVAVLSQAGDVLAAASSDEPRRHAELLAPMVAAALADAGVDRRDLTAVVAGTGPAPFTGLRVGLVTARTLGLALGVPVWGVPSLDAVAAAAARTAAPGTTVLVVTDARRHEVYWAAYEARVDGEVRLLGGPEVDRPTDLRERAAGALVVGRGARLHAVALGLDDEPSPLEPDPVELGRLALARTARGEALPAEPRYLRRPDAVPAAVHKRVLA